MILAVLLGLDFYRDRQERIDVAKERLLSGLHQIAARHEALLERAEGTLNEMMLSPELGPHGTVEACRHQLATLKAREPLYLQIGKVLPDGRVPCSAVPDQNAVNVAERAWFKQTMKSHDMVVGDVIVSKIVGKPVIPITKSSWDDSGHVAYLAFLGLGLDWMQQSLAKLPLPNGARLSVVDGKGFMVARYPDPESLTGKSFAQSPIVKRALTVTGDGTWEDRNLVGESRLIAHVSMLTTASGSKYHLLLSIPSATVDGPGEREALIKFTALLAVLTGTLAALLLGTNRILRPLAKLSDTAARHKSGDLAARSGLEYRADEVGQLARAMDESAIAVEDRDRRLGIA